MFKLVLESIMSQEWVLVALAFTFLSNMVIRTKHSLLKEKLRHDNS